MEPINYILDVRSPIEQAMKGFALGRQDIEQNQVMQEREQIMGIRGAQEARAAAQEEERRAAAAAERAKAEAMQAQMMQLRQMALDGTLTTDAVDQAFLPFADTFEEFSAAAENISKPVREANALFGSQLATSLLRGNTDAAVSRLGERIAALENEGSPQSLEEAKRLTIIRDEALIDPQGAGVGLLTSLRVQNLIDDSTMDAVLEAAGQGQAAPEGASPLGKTAQDVRSGLIPQSVLDAEIRIAENAGEEGLTLQQRIAEEARLRGEYQKRTEDLSAAERNFSIIETSAADDSGAGDIALVTSFMKMLDPGSVVRETEFATAANAGGLLATLRGFATRIENGKFLDAKQRADFKRLAGDYLNAAKVQEQGVQQGYQRIVDSYGLDPINVFGARAATAPAPAGGTTPAPADNDAKAAFMANPTVAALAPEVREMAWKIYQEQTGQ